MYFASSAFSKTPFLTPQRKAMSATIPIVPPAISKDQTLLVIQLLLRQSYFGKDTGVCFATAIIQVSLAIVKKKDRLCENNRR